MAPVVQRKPMPYELKLTETYGPRPLFGFEAREIVGLRPQAYTTISSSLVRRGLSATPRPRELVVVGHASNEDWIRMLRLKPEWIAPSELSKCAAVVDTYLLAMQSWGDDYRDHGMPAGVGSLAGHYHIEGVETKVVGGKETFVGAHVAAHDSLVTAKIFLHLLSDSLVSTTHWPSHEDIGFPCKDAEPFDLTRPLPVLRNGIFIFHDSEYRSEPGRKERAGREQFVPEIGISLLDLDEVADIVPGPGFRNWYAHIKCHNVYTTSITFNGKTGRYRPAYGAFPGIISHTVAGKAAMGAVIDQIIMNHCQRSLESQAIPPSVAATPAQPAQPAQPASIPNKREYQLILANMCLDNIARGERCRHFADCFANSKNFICPDFQHNRCTLAFRHSRTCHTVRKCKAKAEQSCNRENCLRTFDVYHVLPNCKEMNLYGDCAKDVCEMGHDAVNVRLKYFEDMMAAGEANYRLYSTAPEQK
ncbi:hypothetical protein PV04_02117 [Phialophora macrospora]|uniref:Uncharacterized protein n=1 Tax=Phialophora macrospora TaxID=1851006 RepID=A0A0D2GNU8_9EURO|nr:hypothetical protein PV04_02117 [Phialophora macrospora]